MMSTTKKDNLSIELQAVFAGLLSRLETQDEPALNRVPFSGSWTAAQAGDHLLRSYDVVGCLTGQTAHTQRDPEALIAPLSEAFLNFDIKMESPDFILPSTGTISKEELLAGLRARMASIIEFADSDADMTLTCLDFEVPTLGTLTRIEWLNFVRVHTMRHNHQLDGILTPSPYPVAAAPPKPPR
ncbi:hypothetical protein GCM10007415_40620 [Parapedobacter pyrenivorans]|uniref:DinB-like domain-containing protein n=1 Tax=Parapedobacter pyrenivorans TaxID=1305674 RepID=A0A917I0A8_9SPHI|nr:DinB family protein [Parapedobacter pyrenivorans]GGH00528.1 hypothetical protein GCM10007415_40620 [Parapedobacter pyrenivorans]